MDNFNIVEFSNFRNVLSYKELQSQKVNWPAQYHDQEH